MRDHSEMEAAPRVQPAQEYDERALGEPRHEGEPARARPAEELAAGLSTQGVLWRWHRRRRRER